MALFGAKAKVRVQVDTKALASLRKLNLSAQNCSLTVGVHDDAGTYEDAPGSKPGKPVSVAEVALWHEYGNRYVPARPFFYPALKDAERGIAKLQASVMANLIAKKETLLHGLSRIGFYVQTKIQNKLLMGEFLPLSPGYLAKRLVEYPNSGDRPLLRSRLLLRSIRFKAAVDGQTQDTKESEQPPLISPEAARKDAKADKKRRAAQRRAAKADPAAAKAAFDAQHRKFAPRKPPPGKKGG